MPIIRRARWSRRRGDPWSLALPSGRTAPRRLPPATGKPLRGKECSMSGPYRVGVDVGGTFSDFVILDESTGAIRVLKLPSTPADPSLAVLDGVSRLTASGVPPAAIAFFSHGTTVATNALLESKGATTGLLVTE